MDNIRNIVIVGATSAIAEHCARLWVEGHRVNLTLIGRDSARLERIAQDLKTRSPGSTFSCLVADFVNPDSIQTAVDQTVSDGPVDMVLIAHGALPDQQDCQGDLALCRETLEINAISPVLFAEAYASHMEKAGRGSLAIIGSVAGDRGRKSNYIYGSAKGLIERYAQGLQHRLAGTEVSVVLIKPGPTDTPMTAQLKSQGARLAPVESVAAHVVKAIERRQPVVYVPQVWRVIMWIIRNLPDLLFKRLNI